MQKLIREEFIEKAREVHGDKYDYSEVVYVDSRTKIRIICPIHGPFCQIPNNHLRGRGCLECSGHRKSTTEEFIKKAREVHGNKYDYSKVEYKNAFAKVCIVCLCLGHEPFWQTPNNHLRGRRCPKCMEKRSTTEEFIKRAREVYGDQYDYSEVKYVNSYTKVRINCPEHGEFCQTPDNHLKGRGCSQCNQSKLEQAVQKKLKDGGVRFTYNEYNFDWLKLKKKLQLDFYLPDYNVAIECQGEQHFVKYRYEQDEIKLDMRQKRDKLKKNLCEEHGVKLYYINYNDNIEEKMNEILNNIKNI
jgi:very-short-patch-repair endonuclease